MQSIILASSSPRRTDILTSLCIPFHALKPPFEEIVPPGMPVDFVAEYFASQKAESTASMLSDKYKNSNLVVAADTIIIHENHMYGKSKDRNEARYFLQTLSKTTHRVVTGLAVYNRTTAKMLSCTCSSFVTIANLSEENIEWYLDKNEWTDAAGAYKIQGVFQRYISHIKGSYSSILGLPIFEFYGIMEKQGYEFS